MTNKKKSGSNIALIIIVIIIITTFLIFKNSPENKNYNTTEEIAKCIGEDSILYTELGCHACEIQEKMFGENYQYLNVIDCWYEEDKCDGIEETPTWIVKGEKYEGVQEIEKLQELTGC